MRRKCNFFFIITLFFVIIQLLIIYLGFVVVFKTETPWNYYKDFTGYIDSRIFYLPPVTDSDKTERDITVVTAFFDIGGFSKRESHYRDKDTYYQWMERFRYITNNVVFFTDSEESRHKMADIRRTLSNKTKIIQIDRSNTWPFQNLQQIETIFKSKAYVSFTSIYPVYICVTHEKFYAMKIAAEQNFFNTQYIMWLDIGYFRKRTSKSLFHLVTPMSFDKSRIAITQVYPNKTFHVVPKMILQSKNVIVSAALFLGERNRMLQFVSHFKKAVEYFLRENVMNTDEQVLYAMYSDRIPTSLQPEVKLQLYPAEREKDWLYIGYTMIKEFM